MNTSIFDPDEPIAALATPWGVSALAVVRTTGVGCIEALAGVFSAPGRLKSLPGGASIVGNILHPVTGEPADQVVALIFRGPVSYTGQDAADICCHGGLPAVRKVLDALKAGGFRDAGPGEFTLRAFLNGKMDLTEAEAVNELITAKTRHAHNLAFHRLSGSIKKRIDEAKHALVEIMSSVEIALDYSEDEIDDPVEISVARAEAVREDLAALAATYRTGKIFQEGIRLVLAGRTNAGKSSLFNLLLKEDRAIVSEIHGTTRDYIESWITLNGLPVQLFDTAGLRPSENPVEAEGIRRSGEIIENADVVVYLVDSREGPVQEDSAFLTQYAGKVIPVWSKSDLSSLSPPGDFLPVSSVTGEGRESLEQRIFDFVLSECPMESTVIDSIRQKDCIDRCVAALERFTGGLSSEAPLDAVACDLKEAVDALGEITGEVTTSDVLDLMFSRFCVGK